MNKKRSKVITLSLPIDFLAEIDTVAKKQGRTRSELLREGCRRYLSEESRWQDIRSTMRDSLRKIGINTEEELYDKMTEWRHEESEQKQGKPTKSRS